MFDGGRVGVVGGLVVERVVFGVRVERVRFGVDDEMYVMIVGCGGEGCVCE